MVTPPVASAAVLLGTQSVNVRWNEGRAGRARVGQQEAGSEG